MKEWKSPSSLELKKKASFMKRSDPDRGLERVGRYERERERGERGRTFLI